jgi:hypothetical protein
MMVTTMVLLPLMAVLTTTNVILLTAPPVVVPQVRAQINSTNNIMQLFVFSFYFSLTEPNEVKTNWILFS